MLIRICDINRRTSMIRAVPTIDNLKQKGHQYFNIIVDRIVLEEDGSDVMENEVVQCCAEDKAIFMLLSSEQNWSNRHEIIQIYETQVAEVVESDPSKTQVVAQTEELIAGETFGPSTSIFIDEHQQQQSQSTLKRKAEEELDASDLLLESTQETGNSSKNDNSLIKMQTKTTKEKHGSSEMYNLANFRVDWNAISRDIVEELHKCHEKKMNLNNNVYNRLTSQIVEQIREVSTVISSKVFGKVAFSASKKFPILQDTDGVGNLIGEGSFSFAEKLRAHNNYIQRVLRGKQTTTQKVPKGKSFAGVDSNYLKSGNCICDKNDIAALQRSSCENVDEELLERTRSFIRFKLDNTSVVTLVKDLPIIRSNKLLSHHFKAATNIDPSNFNKTFIETRDKLIKATKKSRKHKDAESYSDTEVFVRISEYLREDFENMFKTFEEGTTLDQVETNNPYPTILAFDEGDQTMAYYIQTDNAIVSEKVGTIVEAAQLCIMIYFIYFMKYPENLSKTLEFLQIYLLKINIQESRVTRKKGCNPKKGIVALIRKLSKYDITPDAEAKSSDSDQH